MKRFKIVRPDRGLAPKLQDKIDNLTKPKGSLGRLEELAMQVGLIQQTLSPELRKPANILFGADHGVIEEGVTVSPKEVTWQQLAHFSKGGAGINFLCNQHGFRLVLVDAGTDYDIPADSGIIDMKVGRGTRNFLHGPAMTADEWRLCLERGAKIVDSVHADGCNVVSFGEMGSGNTSPSSMWMHLLTGIPLADCVGAGAGLDSPGVTRKLDVLTRSLENYRRMTSAPGNEYTADGLTDMERALAWFGGYELVMATAGMLRAAELGMTIIVDGFIMTACMAAAKHFHPEIEEYAIFGHQGDENGHRRMLEAIGARPLLSLGLRLGEGSGAVCAFPIIDSAVRMINEMDDFSVGVTKYF